MAESGDELASEYVARHEAMAVVQAKLLQSLGETAGILGAQLSLQEASLPRRLPELRRIAATQRAIKTELDAIYQRLRAARARLESKHAWAVQEAERQVDLALGHCPRERGDEDEDEGEDKEDGERSEDASLGPAASEPPVEESVEEREERTQAAVETWLRESAWDSTAP